LADDDEPTGTPRLLLGDDFGEDEATALDLSVNALRAPPPEDEDEDEDDYTEILRPLPPRADAAPGGQTARGVVPIDDDGRAIVGSGAVRAAPSGNAPPLLDEDDADAETVQLSRPPPSMVTAGERAPSSEGGTDTMPRVRQLDDVMPPLIEDDISDDKTLSRPKVVRMTFRPAGKLPSVDAGAREAQAAPAPQPSDEGAAQEPRAAEEDLGAAETLDDDEAPGRMIIAAPDNATVFVDGVERGRGEVAIEALDRHQRLAVRVHQPGCRPWSQSVSIDGRAELRVTAEPEPR
jgi:hypothetical protein